jgi:DinB superfamily
MLLHRRFIEDAIQLEREQNMSEAAVVTPPIFTISRPHPDEYAPYYDRYISLVVSQAQGEDILNALDQQRRQMMLLLCGRDDADGDLRYAPDKWSAKEVLGHVCDTERIFAYRALRIARADATPLEGFEQDDYVRNGPFANRPLADLIEDFIAVRRATLSLLRNLDEAAWMRRGIANKNEVSVRALAYIIAGHELHHHRILEEKYFARMS